MYVCLCKAITQKQIDEKMKLYGGNKSLVLKSLGVGSQCGGCLSGSVFGKADQQNSNKANSNSSFKADKDTL